VESHISRKTSEMWGTRHSLQVERGESRFMASPTTRHPLPGKFRTLRH
jgi:hypothetical protein